MVHSADPVPRTDPESMMGTLATSLATMRSQSISRSVRPAVVTGRASNLTPRRLEHLEYMPGATRMQRRVAPNSRRQPCQAAPPPAAALRNAAAMAETRLPLATNAVGDDMWA